MDRNKAIAALVVSFLCVSSSISCAQVTTNVFRRIFLISDQKSQVGTAFTIEVDARQYLITAKHVVKQLKDVDEIGIRKNGRWTAVKVKIFRCDDPADIAVLVPPSQLSVNFPLEPIANGMFYGSEAYFLGFPYGMTPASNRDGGYPEASIKRATVSTMTPLVLGKGLEFTLDGYNNPGFSGSPVVYRDIRTPGSPFKVARVVISFLPEAGPVLKTVQINPQQITNEDRTESRLLEHNGKIYRVTGESNEFVRLNTGIAFAHDIQFAVDLIRKHPEGPAVTDDFEPDQPGRD